MSTAFRSAPRDPPSNALTVALLDPTHPTHVVKPEDVFRDYCLAKYRARVDPVGRLRSTALLAHTLPLSKAPSRLAALLAQVQQRAGVNRTVWGLKHHRGHVTWELYFYNHGRKSTNLSASEVMHAVADFARAPFRIDERIPYFMCSIEIGDETLSSGELTGVRLYTAGDDLLPTGLSYQVSEQGMRLENHYAFYRPRRQRALLEQRLQQSAFLGGQPLSKVLWPELEGARRICVANKASCDAVYFSRLRLGSFAFALQRLEFPDALRHAVSSQSERLEHMKFDVGFDFFEQDGALRIRKSSFYGTL